MLRRGFLTGIYVDQIKGFTAEVTSEVFALLRHSPRMTMTDGGKMVWEESSDPNAGGNGAKADEPHRHQGPDESNDELKRRREGQIGHNTTVSEDVVRC